jgi:hypothetical protein
MEWTTFVGSSTWRLTDTVIKDRIMKQIRVWWNVSPNSRYFPGPQPVSIERKDFETLKYNNYWVSYKSDGVRFLFVFLRIDDKNYALLVNRNTDMYLVRVTTAQAVFQGTVLDGELVYDQDAQRHEYIVYDATIVCGFSVVQDPLSARLEKALTVTNHVTKSDIPLKIKLFYPLRDFDDYVKHVVPEIRHGTDGYIFTPENSPVLSGTHYRMFKWKEQMKNTVDFQVEKDRLRLSKGNTTVGVPDKLVDVNSELAKRIRKGPCIVECRYVSPQKWTPILIREDKSHPNNVLTYTKTLFNIEENIQIFEFNQVY